MKSTSLLLSCVLLFILTACSKKSASEEQAETHIIEKKNIAEVSSSQPQTFILTDIDERDLNMTLDGNQTTFQDIDQPLVLLNLFATWCPPCKGALLGLSQLQKNHQKDLFVVGILVNDDLNNTGLRHFMEKYDANFYISYAKDNTRLATQIIKKLELPENFPIPLSILYNNGEIFRYYEGAVPIEIMENELKQALKQP